MEEKRLKLQNLIIKNDTLYLDGMELKNVKEFTLKSSAMDETELNVTIYVTTRQDSFG
jgi:hypothetical protein